MFDPLSISGVAYDENQFINNLPAYNASRGTDEMLDLIREIQQSGNYYWQGVSFPNGDLTTVPAYATINGTIQVPQGTYVTGITHYEDNEGFKLKIYDKGSKASIFYGEYSLARVVSSNMQQQYGVGASNPSTDMGMNLDNPFGPNYLLSPFIINTPGVLGWEVVNLSGSSAVIQVLLQCAIPVNKQSIGNRVITRG